MVKQFNFTTRLDSVEKGKNKHLKELLVNGLKDKNIDSLKSCVLIVSPINTVEVSIVLTFFDNTDDGWAFYNNQKMINRLNPTVMIVYYLIKDFKTLLGEEQNVDC